MLFRSGWDVTVLEARSHVGGRVFSLHEFSDGLVAEGGGEFIDHRHKRMLALAKEFNLTLGSLGGWHAESGDWGLFRNKAGLLSDEKIWGANLEDEYHKMWVELSKLGKLVNDPSNPQNSPNAKELDAKNVAEWIQSQNVHPIAKDLFVCHIRAEFTCEPEDFSFLDFARNASLFYSDPEEEKPNYRIMGGNEIGRAHV